MQARTFNKIFLLKMGSSLNKKTLKHIEKTLKHIESSTSKK